MRHLGGVWRGKYCDCFAMRGGNLLSRRVTGKRPTGFTQRRQGCAKAAKKTDAARLGKRLQVRDPRNWLELGAAAARFARRSRERRGPVPVSPSGDVIALRRITGRMIHFIQWLCLATFSGSTFTSKLTFDTATTKMSIISFRLSLRAPLPER